MTLAGTAMPLIGANLASIPSPSSNALRIGPLSLNAYGLMIAIGIVAAVWMFGRRLDQRRVVLRPVPAGEGGRGNGATIVEDGQKLRPAGMDAAGQVAVWAVAAGVVGARLYHVVTDWDRFEDDLAAILRVWEGGLGIPGGLLAGVTVGIWAARRAGISAADAATCAAPALPLAQAIGRWGNWFNQELFGRPTALPWALEIDERRTQLAGYEAGTTFHPTFLYESLWNLGLFGVLLAIDRRWSIAKGGLFAVYVAGYGIGRFWVEALRIDEAHELAGLRLNQWVAFAAVVVAGMYLGWVHGRGGITRRAVDSAGVGASEEQPASG